VRGFAFAAWFRPRFPGLAEFGTGMGGLFTLINQNSHHSTSEPMLILLFPDGGFV
jgi:hypothetical protein